MGWETIKGTDARFMELTSAYRDHEEKIEKARPIYSKDERKRSILFWNPDTRVREYTIFSQEIKFLSEVNPLNEEEILGLLQNQPEEREPFRELKIKLCFQLMARPDLRTIVSYCPSDTDQEEWRRYEEKIKDLTYIFCFLQIHIEGRGFISSRNATALYFDKSLHESYAWMRQFEETVQKLNPWVTFWNKVGPCKNCGETLNFTELHEFECKRCAEASAKRDEQIREEKIRERKEAKLDTKSRKVRIFSLLDRLVVNRSLRLALYQVYRGRCQYCSHPTIIPLDEMCIEHIIPSSIELASIPQRLRDMGVRPQDAESFIRILPPFHDCVLNYTLACRKHNSRKGGRILNPAALDLLLHKSKQKASKVLAIYSQKKKTRST